MYSVHDEWHDHANGQSCLGIRNLPEEEKLKVLDALLTDLDRRDAEIDQVWATEARKRWNAYKAGEVATVSYEELMAKYSR